MLVDRLDRIVDAIAIGRRSLGIARQSVIAGMWLSFAAMILAAAGLIAPVGGALLQEAIDVAVIANALRRCARDRRLTGEARAGERASAPRTGRSYASIVRANVFTVFNLILAVAGAMTLAFGEWQDALFLGVLVANASIGTVQEVRAKRALDRLSALVAPHATVVRDGSRAPGARWRSSSSATSSGSSPATRSSRTASLEEASSRCGSTSRSSPASRASSRARPATRCAPAPSPSREPARTSSRPSAQASYAERDRPARHARSATRARRSSAR